MIIIEIPAHSKVKYESEIFEKGRVFKVDRVVDVPYPVAYGALTGTLAQDGDEVDVFVIGRKGEVGCTYETQALCPLVTIHMRDGADADDKLVYGHPDVHPKELWQKLCQILVFLKIYKRKMVDGQVVNDIRLEGVVPLAPENPGCRDFYAFCIRETLPFMTYDGQMFRA